MFPVYRRLVELKENFNSSKPTYSHLLAFLKSRDYSNDPFAPETLHNDAELEGIKCALVWWEAANAERTPGLAYNGISTPTMVSNAAMFNAFITQDRGLVFADPKDNGHILYIEKGKPVGRISIADAIYADYSYFENYSRMVDSETERINKLMPSSDLQFPTYYIGTIDQDTDDQNLLNTGKCDFYW
jgi:hypothetical protein